MKLLSIDIGTTSMRGILYNEAGKALKQVSVQTPLVFHKQFIEQTPKTYTDALLTICKGILTKGSPDALSITAFRSAPVLVDKEGTPLTNFIMWQDTRNKAICDRILSHNKRVRSITGAGINTVFTASKITWWKEQQSALFRKAYKALIVPDYLMHVMTGVFATDYTYGSRTSLMDLQTKAWSQELFDLFSLPMGILSDLIPQGSIYGTVNKAFAQLSGLKQGIPVITAGGDQQCGALGLGALTQDQLVINCGTGSFIIGLTDTPVLTDSPNICNVSALPGMYTVESNVLSSAAALDWMMRELFSDLKTKKGLPDYEAAGVLAASASPGSGGIRCVPLFAGCGTRDWHPEARASFTNLSLSSTRGDLIRSMFEGIAAEIVKSIQALPGGISNASQAFLGGGLTKSDLFAQILSDMSGIKLTRYADAQATAIGAFLRASVTLGLYPDEKTAFRVARGNTEQTVFKPHKKLHSVYDAVLNETEQAYRVLLS